MGMTQIQPHNTNDELQLITDGNLLKCSVCKGKRNVVYGHKQCKHCCTLRCTHNAAHRKCKWWRWRWRRRIQRRRHSFILWCWCVQDTCVVCVSVLPVQVSLNASKCFVYCGSVLCMCVEQPNSRSLELNIHAHMHASLLQPRHIVVYFSFQSFIHMPFIIIIVRCIIMVDVMCVAVVVCRFAASLYRCNR